VYWSEFLAIAIAHLFAVASPGPDFAIVTRQSVMAGTRIGIWTSLGVGAGILVHVSYCILGVALLLTRYEQLFNLMKLLAAGYLCFLGVQSIRESLRPQLAVSSTDSVSAEPGRAFWSGFLTNGLNPKATLFFLALFTVVIDIETPTSVQIAYGLYLALATFAWFAMLSTVLGRQQVRDFMLRAGVWFERGMGIILILLAIQIVVFA